MANTLAEVEADLLTAMDNSYLRSGSVDGAWDFIALCDKWLLLKPQQASHSSNSGQFNVGVIERMRAEAMQFISAKSTGGVRFLGVRNDFR